MIGNISSVQLKITHSRFIYKCTKWANLYQVDFLICHYLCYSEKWIKIKSKWAISCGRTTHSGIYLLKECFDDEYLLKLRFCLHKIEFQAMHTIFLRLKFVGFISDENIVW